jgi:uncharacterized protein YndB with AHSA1/START domain
MNILVIIGLAVAAIIVLFLLIAAFTKRSFALQKQIVINKPKQRVFDYIRLLKNQEHYSVWVMKDPNIKIVYTGVDGTVGFTSAWRSDDKNVGIGEQEIIKIDEGEAVEVEIRFEKPFKATNRAINKLATTADGQTLVTQTFLGTSKFPMNIMNLFIDKLAGKDMQTTLQNLKRILENS